MKKLFILLILSLFLNNGLIHSNIKVKKAPTIKGVSFKDEPGSLTIENKSNFDLIIFAGKVENGNILGGITKGESRSFDLSKIKGIPNKGAILIRAVSTEVYKKNNFKVTEDNVVYSGLVVYDLTNKSDKTKLNIFNKIAEVGSTYIYVSNTSPYVLELRLDSPLGEKVATLLPHSINKKVWLVPKDDGLPYYFWPTYVYVDPNTNEIVSFSSNDVSAAIRSIPELNGVYLLDFKGPTNGKIEYKIGFIKVRNNTRTGLVFYNGSELLPDQKGLRFLRPGSEGIFEFDVLSGESGSLYTSLNLETNLGKKIPIAPMTIKAGVIYDLLVIEKDNDYFYDYREVGKKNIIEDLRVNLLLE